MVSSSSPLRRKMFINRQSTMGSRSLSSVNSHCIGNSQSTQYTVFDELLCHDVRFLTLCFVIPRIPVLSDDEGSASLGLKKVQQMLRCAQDDGGLCELSLT